MKSENKQELLDFLEAKIKAVKKSKDDPEFLTLCKNIVRYIKKNTEDDYYDPETSTDINNNRQYLAAEATKLCGTDEWKKYLQIIYSGRTFKYVVCTNHYGRKVWNENSKGNINQEGERSRYYWYKIRPLVDDFNIELEKKKEEKKEQKKAQIEEEESPTFMIQYIGKKNSKKL